MDRAAVDVGLALGLVMLIVIALLGSRVIRQRAAVAAPHTDNAALRQREPRAVDDDAMRLSGPTSGRATRLFTTRGDRDAVLEREARDRPAAPPAEPASSEQVVAKGQVPGWGGFDLQSPTRATRSGAPETRG